MLQFTGGHFIEQRDYFRADFVEMLIESGEGHLREFPALFKIAERAIDNYIVVESAQGGDGARAGIVRCARQELGRRQLSERRTAHEQHADN